MKAESQNLRRVYFFAFTDPQKSESAGAYLFYMKRDVGKKACPPICYALKSILNGGHIMTDDKQERRRISEYEPEDIQIIEESCGRFVRVCDPAEFGIVVKKKTPVKYFTYPPKIIKSVRAISEVPKSIPIIEESFGTPIRTVDISQLHLIFPKQLKQG